MAPPSEPSVSTPHPSATSQRFLSSMHEKPTLSFLFFVFGLVTNPELRQLIDKATKDEDDAELMALMPYAWRVRDFSNNFADAPAIFQVARSGMPAIADCHHEYMQKVVFQGVCAGSCCWCSGPS